MCVFQVILAYESIVLCKCSGNVATYWILVFGGNYFAGGEFVLYINHSGNVY